MNCREARQLMTDKAERKSHGKLQAHLDSCPRCAREAASLQTLDSGMAALRTGGAGGKIPFEFIKGRIAAETAGRPDRKERRVWVGPVLSAAAGLLVLTVAFFPWKEHKVIGYEVAISGVERELVEETDLMCDILMDLGLADADIDLIGCEATCKLQVVRLKNETEARLVQDAVANIQDPDIKVQIKPVHGIHEKELL